MKTISVVGAFSTSQKDKIRTDMGAIAVPTDVRTELGLVAGVNSDKVRLSARAR